MDFIYIIIILIIFMIVLIYLSGWFAGSETAITNLTTSEIAQMRRNKEKNIDYIMKNKRNLDRTLVSILTVNNIINIILSSIAAVVANELFQAVGVSIMIVLVTVLIIIFGEIIPKSNAIWETKRVAQKNSKAIYYISRAFNPLNTFFMGISRGILSLAGKKIKKENMLITDESIKDIATLGEEEGIIKKIEREIIHNVFIFGDRKIEEIMLPMKKVFVLEKKGSISDVKQLVAQHGFTRVPVVDDSQNVIGILYSKDLIQRGKDTFQSLIREPLFVSGKSEITEIFNAMRKKKIHLAIVRDESKNHIGIVTLEDILEELVGEIYDEYFDVKYSNIRGNGVNTDVPTST